MDEEELLEGPLATEVAAVLLYLTWLRATTLVGLALAEQFPDYASWEAVLDDPATRRDIERFAGVLAEIKAVSALGGLYDVEEAEQEGGRRGEALEALRGLAGRLGVGADDLLSALLHA